MKTARRFDARSTMTKKRILLSLHIVLAFGLALVSPKMVHAQEPELPILILFFAISFIALMYLSACHFFQTSNQA